MCYFFKRSCLRASVQECVCVLVEVSELQLHAFPFFTIFRVAFSRLLFHYIVACSLLLFGPRWCAGCSLSFVLFWTGAQFNGHFGTHVEICSA